MTWRTVNRGHQPRVGSFAANERDQFSCPSAAGAFLSTVTKECVMHNGPKTIKSARPLRPASSFATRSKRWISRPGSSEPEYSQNAQKNYERYLALARAEALIGNTVGAENYYQHAEHYFRSMNSAP